MDAINTPANPAVERILETFGLTPEQCRAAATRGRDIVVTAGAGSGKTRTLVARYISLLAEGLSPRRAVAITFTERAAREMRSRVRSALAEQISQAHDLQERSRWVELDAQMDAARIGTIHSLCAEILRAHPAKAGIDPRFEVLEEGLAATLRSQAIQDTLAWLVAAPQLALLLRGFSTRALQTLLTYLLERRLETQAAFDNPQDVYSLLKQVLQTGLAHPDLAEPLAGLRELHASGRLRRDAGDTLADQIEELLSIWGQAEAFLAGGDWFKVAGCLFNARRQQMGGRAGSKNSLAKGLLVALKNAYDLHLDPWLGGQKAGSLPPDEQTEALFQESLPLLRLAFEHLLLNYQAALRQRQALDFDDLEGGAARLLAQPALRRLWQAQVEALLVDEFQDTNARQREIVLALCGDTPGRLFVVGDARQSIYRFRQADVTVFRRLQEDIQTRGGLLVNLDITYRAHTALLQVSGDLLAAVMGDQPDPQRPYYVPFAPLRSDHDLPRAGMHMPHVEFILGCGQDADSARPAAARALAQRLQELHQAGQIQRWDDVALLLRASTGFPAYEDAFEAYGIPFVTVAGQGFYNRPEIRDVLNLLRALADPWDDLAMAGLLRSPAFGLSDAALYQLRWRGDQLVPYWKALQADGAAVAGLTALAALGEADQNHARRAVEILRELLPFVDRWPVADLLKRLVDRVDYRAILASPDSVGSAGRLWRNLDKLLNDAQASKLINVRAFLEYLDTLRAIGAREGEAPAEAEGAVRLMTIHKAKGLEFPIVVLADAARKPKTTGATAYLLPETSLAFKFDQLEAAPLLFKLAQFHDREQAEAEEKRLLYVALTRAQEKLLISGHRTLKETGECKTDGWLNDLLAAAQVDLDAVLAAGQPIETTHAVGGLLRVWIAPPADQAPHVAPSPALVEPLKSHAEPLYRSLLIPPMEPADPDPADGLHPWRVAPKTGQEHMRPPADALGNLVHQALQRWLFPGNPALPRLLETAALQAGLADQAQRAEALRLAESLLARLQHHPVRQEIDQALERHHEVPYTYPAVTGRLDSGYIDLLYRNADGWTLVDFKTDALRSPADREAALAKYQPQMQRYAQAVQRLLGVTPRVCLCFLDDEGRVSTF